MRKIVPEEHAMKLTTTLNRLKEHHACQPRYEHLVKALGGVGFDHDQPINLLTILETNGLDDCLWALRATAENCDRVARLMAADFAEDAQAIWRKHCPKDDRPAKAIDMSRRFAVGKASHEQLTAAWAAAGAAAEVAARQRHTEIVKRYLLA